MIGLKKTCATFSAESDAKPKPMATWSHAFSRAWRRLRIFALSFALSFHWFIVKFTFVVIGHCDCFGFQYTRDRSVQSRIKLYSRIAIYVIFFVFNLCTLTNLKLVKTGKNTFFLNNKNKPGSTFHPILA